MTAVVQNMKKIALLKNNEKPRRLKKTRFLDELRKRSNLLRRCSVSFLSWILICKWLDSAGTKIELPDDAELIR
jgi:hypothetical protein